jgi:3-oxoacyl-[acyl-carrier-protein] synthase-3
LYKLYDLDVLPEGIMPMTIGWLGNSSVATIPTMLDLILHHKLKDHRIQQGDTVVFASVGAGMNINAIVYRF